MEEWAEIRRLYLAENVPIKEIARRLGLARNTVRDAVRSCEPPRYVRTARPSAVDAVEPAIRELLHAHPRMPATVIAERIGWSRGITILKDRIQELRPAYLPPDPAGRTTYRPGELAQWDLWFPAVDIPIGPEKACSVPGDRRGGGILAHDPRPDDPFTREPRSPLGPSGVSGRSRSRAAQGRL